MKTMPPILLGSLALLVFGLRCPDPARAYEPGAHEFITYKAADLLPAAAPAREWLFTHIGHGAYYEDFGPGEDHVFCYDDAFSANTLPHFWRPDGGIADEMSGPGGGWPNAWMKASGYNVMAYDVCGSWAQGLWPQAVAYHAIGQPWFGYERLGHISHLLQDMSVPAHVHEDMHPGAENYEDSVSTGILWGWLLPALDPGQLSKGLIAIPGAEIDKYISTGALVTGNPPVTADLFGLYYLMYTTAQRADFFASTDDWGNPFDQHGWVSPSYFAPPPEFWGQFSYYQGPPARMGDDYTLLSFCTYCGAIGCIGCEGPTPCSYCGSWTTPCNPALLIATKYTLVYAVRATATLMALYDNKVNGRIRNLRTGATYALIQAAIVESIPGDVIEVAPGTYYESLKFFGKQVHLRSTGGPLQTTIHGNGNPHVVQCVDGEGPGTILEGFTITGGHALGAALDAFGAGLLALNSSPTIRNCAFTGNAAHSGGALADGGTRGPTVVNCLIYGNTATTNGGGVLSLSSSGAVLQHCTVVGNWAKEIGGGGVGGRWTNCIVYYNSAAVEPNLVNAGVGHSCTTPLPATGTGNITNEPTFLDLSGGDVRLAPGSPCIDAGVDLSGSVTNDILGNPRPLDGDGDNVAAFDLGAFEVRVLPSTLVVNTNSNRVGDTSGLSAPASANDLVNCTGGSCIGHGSLSVGPLYSSTPYWILPAGDVFSINNGNATTTRSGQEDGAYLPATLGGGSLPCALGFVLNTNAATGGSPNGYHLTGINSFAGFWTNSRTLANQKFRVEFRQVGQTVLTLMGVFNYTPFATGDDGPSSTLVSISATGSVLAAHVEEIQLTYLDHGIAPGGIPPTIDGTVLKEVDIFGFASLAVSQPSPRQIVQRDADNRANLRIEGALGRAFTRVEARAIVMSGAPNTGQSTDWTNIVTTPGSGAFVGTLQGVAAGGWYQIEVRVYDGDLLLDEAVVKRIGVGDIIITVGQFNAGCFGSPRQVPSDDRVSAYNLLTGTWQFAADPQPNISGGMGTNGSPWPRLGTMLATSNQVPVGFVGIAYGATFLCQWLPGSCIPPLPLYQKLTNALVHFGPQGIRCVLWHQGESDALGGNTSAAVYSQFLSNIVAQSRSDAGWSVPWGIAETTYAPGALMASEEAVAAGQRAVVYGNTNVFRGPRTDDFAWEGKVHDGVHFSQAGLDEHADQWFQALEGFEDLSPKNGDFENTSGSPAPVTDGVVYQCLSTHIWRVIGWNLLDASGTTSAGGVSGFFNPNSLFYSGSEDTLPHGGVLPNMNGPRVAFLLSTTSGDSFLQTLPARLKPSTVYTLTAAIGVRDIGTTPFGGYQVEWLANGQSLGTPTTGNRATLDAFAGGEAAGRFTIVTNTYISPASVAPNQQLAIRITKPTGGGTPTYLDFDNVQVTSQLTPYGQFQFANWFNLNAPESVPTADADVDGYSNWDEFIADTCPISANSVPRILQIVLAGTEVRVQVQTCAGSIYQLECCHGLPAAPDDWTPVGPAVEGDGQTMALVDPEPSLTSQRFYRVRISR